MSIENPFVILAIAIFAFSAAATVFGPARWQTGRPKPKFAMYAGCLLIAGVVTFLFARS